MAILDDPDPRTTQAKLESVLLLQITLPVLSVEGVVSSKFCMLEKHFSIPPAAAESLPKCTPADEGVVGVVIDLVHEILLALLSFLVYLIHKI